MHPFGFSAPERLLRANVVRAEMAKVVPAFRELADTIPKTGMRLSLR